MTTVGIIRERGQLTLPESIRKLTRWTGTSSVVSITIEKPDEIIITPHQAAKEAEWEKLFELIKKSRDIKGKPTTSASEFITRDRNIKY